MSELAAGTLCYLVNLTEMKELSGRVVEVISGPLTRLEEPEDPFGWYEYTAPWSREMFPGCVTMALRRNLQPIVPPDVAPSLDRVAEESARNLDGLPLASVPMKLRDGTNTVSPFVALGAW